MEELRGRLGTRLHLLGWRGDIAAVLAAMDVVVNTSENEGMPVALIEAGGAAKPVVATDVGSTREVVASDETGFVLDYDADAFADRVLKLLADPGLRAAMGESGRARVVERFSDARLAADVAKMYERLVADVNR